MESWSAWEEGRVTEEMPDEVTHSYRRYRHGTGSFHSSRDRKFLSPTTLEQAFWQIASSLTLPMVKELRLSFC